MLSAKTVRKQLALLKPLMRNISIKSARRTQNKIGELMEFKFRDLVISKKHKFENFVGDWVIPKD